MFINAVLHDFLDVCNQHIHLGTQVHLGILALPLFFDLAPGFSKVRRLQTKSKSDLIENFVLYL